MEEVPKKENKPPVKLDFYAEELLQKIKEQNIPIHPTVWELLGHVLGNRAYAITTNLGDFLETPKWILKTCSFFLIFLSKISGVRGKTYTIEERMSRALNNAYQLKLFMERLRDATEKKTGF